MSRCPNCGTWVHGRLGYHGDLTCPNCGARLRISGSSAVGPFTLFLFVWLIALPLTWRFGFFWLFILLCCVPAMRKKVEVVQLNTISIGQTSCDRSGRTRSATTLNRQSAVNQQPVFTQSQHACKYCSYCGAAVSMRNWKFCQNCGASLSTETSEAPHLSERRILGEGDHASKCMVCGLTLSENQSIAYCPHCGNAAHKTHLLEWLHVKKYCPVCAQHLTEQEIE